MVKACGGSSHHDTEVAVGKLLMLHTMYATGQVMQRVLCGILRGENP